MPAAALPDLVWTAPKGHPEVARLLIEAGANVDAIDADGKTPLAIALKENNDERTAQIRDAGDKKQPRRGRVLLSKPAKSQAARDKEDSMNNHGTDNNGLAPPAAEVKGMQH